MNGIAHATCDTQSTYNKHMEYEDFGCFITHLGKLIADGTFPDMDAPNEGIEKAASNSAEISPRWNKQKPDNRGKFTPLANVGMYPSAYELKEGQANDELHVHAGTMSDFLQGPKIRHLYKDALDTPVYMYHAPDKPGEGGHFKNVTHREKNRDTGEIHLNLAHADPLHALLHEGAHAVRNRRLRRGADVYPGEKRGFGLAVHGNPHNPATFSAYEQQPHEKSARRMAHYAMNGLHEDGESITKALPPFAIHFANGLTKAVRHEAAGKTEVNAATGKTVHGGQFAPGDTPHLVAIHNTTGAGVLAAHELGGIPAPSLAITHPQHGFDSFGDISLVGNKRLIDPLEDSRNKLFESDVYSPRQPLISHDIDSKQALRFEKHIRTLAGDQDYGMGRYFSLDRFSIRTEGGKTRLLEDLAKDGTVQAAFLKTQGVDVSPVQENMRTRSGLPDTSAAHEFNAAHPDLDADWAKDPEKRLELTNLYRQCLAEQFAGNPKEVSATLIPKLMENLTGADGVLDFATTDTMIGDLFLLAHPKMELDRNATRAALETALETQPKEALMHWLREETSQLWKPGYLKMGGRKESYTIDNLVKTMTGKGTRAQEGGIFHSLGAARASGAKDFKTIDAMKKRHGSLVQKAEMEAHKEETDAKFHEWQNMMAGHHRSANYDRYSRDIFGAIDDSSKAIGDYLKGAKTESGMERALYRNGFTGPFPAGALALGMEVAKRLQDSPTEYFEAKLNRPVKLREFSGAVVPHDTDAEVLSALHASGVHDIRHYPRGDRDARRQHLIDMAEHPDVMIKSVWGAALTGRLPAIQRVTTSPFDALEKGWSPFV